MEKRDNGTIGFVLGAIVGAGAAVLLAHRGGNRIPSLKRNTPVFDRSRTAFVYEDPDKIGDNRYSVTPEVLDCEGLGLGVVIQWKFIGCEGCKFPDDAVEFKTPGGKAQFPIKGSSSGRVFTRLNLNKNAGYFKYTLKIIDAHGIERDVDPAVKNGTLHFV